MAASTPTASGPAVMNRLVPGFPLFRESDLKRVDGWGSKTSSGNVALVNSDEPDDHAAEQSPRDLELAVQIAVAFITNVPYLYSTEAGLLAASAAPILMAIANTRAVQKLGRRRAEHSGETMLDAAEAANLLLREFLDHAVSDERRQKLLTRTLWIAQDAALRARDASLLGL